jgi:hypothetical protein
MKKLIIIISVFSVLVAGTAFARGFARNHVPQNPTPVVPAPAPITPVTSISGPQFGVYTNNTQAGLVAFANQLGVSPQWQMLFTDGAFPSGASGNLVIFMEPPFNDAQILSGNFDATLKAFATAASKYSGQIKMPLNEEVNCDNSNPWGAGYKGNTTASVIAAYQHEYTLIKSIAPQVQIGYSVNNGSCYGLGGLTAYYPGANYVDFIGLDGFNFGGQTWAQVFDTAITQLQPLGKPIWITSEGSGANESQFISETFAGAQKYNLSGFLYFNSNVGGGNWTLDSAALLTLQASLK